MLNFTSRTTYYLSFTPTDMRNGREGLAGIIREKMQHDPYSYDEAFIFYSKDYRKVKILHYDINGFVLYQKWFDDGKFLKPRFLEAARCHKISRETLILLLSTSVQTEIISEDEQEFPVPPGMNFHDIKESIVRLMEKRK